MLPQAILFDMDGTLTRPMLDFPRIKAEMGIGARPILEALAEMSPAERRAAEQVLHRHEDLAAEHSTLNAGCRELLDWLDAQRVGVAIITRNRRRSVETVLSKHALKFEVLVTRDDGLFKPDPQPLRLACERLSVKPTQAWMIGDGQYDVEAGIAAGMRTVWISHDRPRPFDAEPWQTVAGLPELHAILKSCLGNSSRV